jgi:hypothetical protein
MKENRAVSERPRLEGTGERPAYRSSGQRTGARRRGKPCHAREVQGLDQSSASGAGPGARNEPAEVGQLGEDLGEGALREHVLLGDRGADLLKLGYDKGVGRVAAGVEASERGETLLLAANLDEPPRRLGEDPDQAGERDRRDDLEGQRKAPLKDGALVVDLEAVDDERGDEGCKR